MTACATEGSTNCYWLAGQQGNGQGVSYIDIDGTAHYAESTYTAADGGTVFIMESDEAFYEITDTGTPCWIDLDESMNCYFEAAVVGTEVKGLPQELAATGAEDISPLTVMAGLVLVIAGIVLKVVMR